MKTVTKLFVLMILLMLSAPGAHADEDATRGVWDKLLEVESRGFLALAGLPCEVHQSFVQERENHPKAWPITYLPTYFSRTVVRAASALNDIAMFPIAAPFTDDLRPITELMGLTDYAWEKEEDL